MSPLLNRMNLIYFIPNCFIIHFLLYPNFSFFLLFISFHLEAATYRIFCYFSFLFSSVFYSLLTSLYSTNINILQLDYSRKGKLLFSFLLLTINYFFTRYYDFLFKSLEIIFLLASYYFFLFRCHIRVMRNKTLLIPRHLIHY